MNEPQFGCELGCGSACDVPPNAAATCTAQGTCDFTCKPGLVRVGDQCVATACEQGDYTCGTLASGADCGTCLGSASCGDDNRCDIPPDASEWNDAATAATWLGNFNDSDDAEHWLENQSIGETVAGIHDEDYFSFHVIDGFDGGNPRADIELTTRASSLGWLLSPHELTVWFRCDSGGTTSNVRCGEWFSAIDENSINDVVLGKGCTAEGTYLMWATISAGCSGTTDSGTVTVRVRKRTPPRGDRYDVHVYVH